MISKLSYIFKYKEHVTKKAKEKQTENIVLTTWTFKQTLMHHLNLSKEQCTIEDAGVIFTISINDAQSCWNGVRITVHQLPRVMFLDVFVDGVQANNIGVLESFDSALVKPKIITTYSGCEVCIVQDYNIIKTYDDVSSYYCNLLYPKLDEFDRKMRLLLYNTYYLVYGSEFAYRFNYYCDDEKLKIRGKNTDINVFCSDNIFYAYDYSQLIDILFVHKRSAPDGTEKTDWELYFADKMQFSEPKEDVEKIKGLRNKVAHCKLFSKNDYEKMVELLDKYCAAFDKAIQLTYSKDFSNEFFNTLKENLEVLADRIKTILIEMI